MASKGGSIQSLRRGLSILELVSTEAQGMTITEIGKELGVHKSTAFRLVTTLAERGYLQQNAGSKRYISSFKMFELGEGFRSSITLQNHTGPFLESLERDTGETAHVAVLTHGKAVFIDKKESSEVLRVCTTVGSCVLPHCSAVGKVLLAYAGESEVDEIIKINGLPALTRKTVTSAEKLKSALADVRKRGYAVDDEETSEGMACIAVPVRDYNDRVVGAVGISGASARIISAKTEDLIKTVKAAGEKISARLGYRESYDLQSGSGENAFRKGAGNS